MQMEIPGRQQQDTGQLLRVNNTSGLIDYLKPIMSICRGSSCHFLSPSITSPLVIARIVTRQKAA